MPTPETKVTRPTPVTELVESSDTPRDSAVATLPNWSRACNVIVTALSTVEPDGGDRITNLTVAPEANVAVFVELTSRPVAAVSTRPSETTTGCVDVTAVDPTPNERVTAPRFDRIADPNATTRTDPEYDVTTLPYVSWHSTGTMIGASTVPKVAVGITNFAGEAGAYVNDEVEDTCRPVAKLSASDKLTTPDVVRRIEAEPTPLANVTSKREAPLTMSEILRDSDVAILLN